MIVVSAAFAACGDSGEKNLFEMDFKAGEGKAATSITKTEATGYYEKAQALNGNTGKVRIKLAEKNLTVAVSCAEKDHVAQASGSASLNRQTGTVNVTSDIKATKKKDNRTCYVQIDKGVEFNYVLGDAGMTVTKGGSFVGLYTKLSDIEK